MRGRQMGLVVNCRTARASYSLLPAAAGPRAKRASRPPMRCPANPHPPLLVSRALLRQACPAGMRARRAGCPQARATAPAGPQRLAIARPTPLPLPSLLLRRLPPSPNHEGLPACRPAGGVCWRAGKWARGRSAPGGRSRAGHLQLRHFTTLLINGPLLPY